MYFNTTQYQEDFVSLITINIFYRTIKGPVLFGTCLFYWGVSILVSPTSVNILSTRNVDIPYLEELLYEIILFILIEQYCVGTVNLD